LIARFIAERKFPLTTKIMASAIPIYDKINVAGQAHPLPLNRPKLTTRYPIPIIYLPLAPVPLPGTSAVNPKIKSPLAIKTTTVIITRIAIIVTARGRCLNESFSVLYPFLVSSQ
jgi:hypothetical protein